MSHMLDCQCYGLAAGPHHATNFILHGLSACALFVLLRRLSGAFWSSAFVAAIFAVHPLHVESVAWVAERKDVLSGLFFFLTLLAYESYVRHGRSTGRYLLATMLFVLGLMAKPMLVTLPLVALLLDYWPLGRFRKDERQGGEQSGGEQSAGRMPAFVPLLLEKLPWLVLSAVSCAITIAAQKEAILPLDRLPFVMRLPNVLTSYAAYLAEVLWPHDLAVYYPHLRKWPPLTAMIASAVLLAGVSLAALRLRKRCPYLLVGWLWYLGMLIPVIGLVQVGGQAMADRYTYLPLIGICIAVAWAARDVTRRWGQTRAAVSALVAVLLATSLAAAWRQTGYWRDGLTIWVRSATCTPENSSTLNHLAGALAEAGDLAGAMRTIERSIEIQPDWSLTHYDHGVYLARAGKTKEAIACTKKAVELDPGAPVLREQLAALLASEHFWREAIAQLECAVELSPKVVAYQESLAWLLATTDPAGGGDPAHALSLAEGVAHAVPSPDDYILDVLAAAYAANGRFAAAAAVAGRAREIALARGRDEQAAEIGGRIKLYQAGKPYRQ
jgi:tetratricopeptide (TPR) repeat protein